MSLKNLIEMVITDAADRDGLLGIASKYPDFGKKVEYAEKWDQWAKDNWDKEHEMTHDEYRLTQEKAALERQLADMPNTEETMTPEQLNQFLESELGKRGYMDQKAFDEKLEATLKAKQEELFRYNAALFNGAKDSTHYANKYYREFGEEVAPDDLLKGATELTEKRKAQGLPPASVSEYYNEFTAEKRAARLKADTEKREADIRADERRKVKEEIHMSHEGQIPVSMEGPEIGHFQMKVTGQRSNAEGEKQALPENVELGKGVIARIRAREGDRKELTGQVQ